MSSIGESAGAAESARATVLGGWLPTNRAVWITLAALLAGSALAGALLGRFLQLDLPDVRSLEDYSPPVMTRLLAADGSTAATFAEQRRILIEPHEVPATFLQALIATEDASFYRHPGIDLKGALRAAWRDLASRRIEQGASTLTMQLAGNLFLDRTEKTVRRKMQEVLLALEIERQYSKQEILRFYWNQIYMGHGRYGLEAASRFYFGKPARELTLTESATLAGLIQRPESITPLRNPARALERRNYVLRRMAAEGFLTPEQAEQAQQQPLDPTAQGRPENSAPYYVEEVRRWLQQQYGSSGLYTAGLEVRTTLDPWLQELANRAVDHGLRELDKRQGWRGPIGRVPDGENPLLWEAPDWKTGIREGDVHDGVVLEADRQRARVRVGPYSGTLEPAQIEWTGKREPGALFGPGDRIRVRVLQTAEEGSVRLELEQEPLVEAALIALEPSTGAVRALVGGFDFERSEYDRAVQAKRQTGSAFKPFVYAAALAEGWTLADTLVDEPTVFLDRRKPEPYRPENYTRTYYETVTLRTALEKSANIATVKLLQHVGYDPVIRTARRLGIRSQLRAYPSLALGTFEASLLELTSAYGTFANQGVLVEPHLVEEVHNRDGAPITTIDPEVRDALPPEIAYLMNRVLGGVISDGTGRAAAGLGLNVAGKTGTTDDNTDAWFIGYSPDLAVGVWVGFDEPRSLGERETGAVAALPIWRSFMEMVHRGGEAREFPVPAGITLVAIDKQTGLKANVRAGCDSVISEAFVAGSEPAEYCSVQHHQRLRFPYPFQRYALDEGGRLSIPEDELRQLLQQETQVYLVDGGQRLEAYTPGGVFGLALSLQPARLDGAARPDWLAERFDTSEWLGIDGRRAHVVWLK